MYVKSEFSPKLTLVSIYSVFQESVIFKPVVRELICQNRRF